MHSCTDVSGSRPAVGGGRVVTLHHTTHAHTHRDLGHAQEPDITRSAAARTVAYDPHVGELLREMNALRSCELFLCWRVGFHVGVLARIMSRRLAVRFWRTHRICQAQ